MDNSTYKTSPSWITEPLGLKNVINNESSDSTQLNSLINVTDQEPFMKGLRQLHFWSKQLGTQTNNNTIIFAFLGTQGLQRPNVIEVCSALDEVVDMSHMIEIFSASNTNFVGVSFSSTVDAQKVKDNFLYYKNCMVCYVDVYSPNTIPFRILWLPPQFDLNQIHKLLDRYAIKQKFKRETKQTGTHRFTPTNSVRGEMELHPGITVDSIPHLVTLPKPFQGSVLISIPTRPSICLKCRSTGHVRKDCLQIKCLTCHTMHLPNSACHNKAYADTVRGNSPNVFIRDWTDDVEDPSSPAAANTSLSSQKEIDKTASVVTPAMRQKLGSIHQVGQTQQNMNIDHELNSNLTSEKVGSYFSLTDETNMNSSECDLSVHINKSTKKDASTQESDKDITPYQAGMINNTPESILEFSQDSEQLTSIPPPPKNRKNTDHAHISSTPFEMGNDKCAFKFTEEDEMDIDLTATSEKALQNTNTLISPRTTGRSNSTSPDQENSSKNKRMKSDVSGQLKSRKPFDLSNKTNVINKSRHNSSNATGKTASKHK